MGEELWRVFAQIENILTELSIYNVLEKPWLKPINNKKLDLNVELTPVFNLCGDDHHLLSKLESLRTAEMFKACQRALLLGEFRCI